MIDAGKDLIYAAAAAVSGRSASARPIRTARNDNGPATRARENGGVVASQEARPRFLDVGSQPVDHLGGEESQDRAHETRTEQADPDVESLVFY